MRWLRIGPNCQPELVGPLFHDRQALYFFPGDGSFRSAIRGSPERGCARFTVTDFRFCRRETILYR